MLKLEIKTELGVVRISPHERGLNFSVPVGMTGLAYDDFLFDNEKKIEKFRVKCKAKRNEN